MVGRFFAGKILARLCCYFEVGRDFGGDVELMSRNYFLQTGFYIKKVNKWQ